MPTCSGCLLRSDRRDAHAFGFPRGQNLFPAPTTIAIDAAFLRVGSARGFLQARSYARARLNKGGGRPRIRNQVAGRLTEIALVGFVPPKSQKRL
jgi:hypothetical protein